MGILCTHNGLCWDGVIHGLLPTDERYISYCWGIVVYPRLLLIPCSRQDAGRTAAGVPRMFPERRIMDRVGVRGFSRYLRYVQTSWAGPPHLTYVPYDQT